jgi:hypothetical protein
MSALGQKQTCAAQKPMSALPPIATEKADIDDMHVGTGDLLPGFVGLLKRPTRAT